MLTAQLDYELPPHLIATQPAQPRDAARLMVVDRQTNHVEHLHVRDLPGLMTHRGHLPNAPRPDDLFVFNQTRVLPALFHAHRADTAGKARGLYLRSFQGNQQCHWEVMLESRGTLRVGERLTLDNQSFLVLTEKLDAGRWHARLESPHDTHPLLATIGSVPLPPYIRRQRKLLHQQEVQPDDDARYNTVFAADPGSVAAPTAGLHFTPELLHQLDLTGLRRASITLHVGLATFAPVRTEKLEDHPIHREPFSVPPATLAALHAARQRGARVIPVGTTTVRALESLPDPLPSPDAGLFSTQTELFITPAGHTDSPHPFRLTDALMTNFHLPRSTLLALVAALPGVGLDRLKTWYRLAIEHQYRFYSYGDAMLIL